MICFHNPDEENGIFSNWYISDFTAGGFSYTSLEQYMMHRKALRFGDDGIAAQIMSTDDPAQIKALGRKVSGYDNHVWNGVRQIVVYEGLLAKFSQNDDLKQLLLATGDEPMAECAATDRIWGNGMSMSDPERSDRAKWQGQNLMGYTLMQVRERLRGE